MSKRLSLGLGYLILTPQLFGIFMLLVDLCEVKFIGRIIVVKSVIQ